MLDQLLEDVRPGWLGWILAESLPPNTEALYISSDWEADITEQANQAARILAIAPSSFVGLEVGGRFRRLRGQAEGSITVASVPLSAVTAVSVSSSFRKWQGGSAIDKYRLEVQLDRALGSWGKKLELPLSDDDYGGDPTQGDLATKSIADALLHSWSDISN